MGIASIKLGPRSPLLERAGVSPSISEPAAAPGPVVLPGERRVVRFVVAGAPVSTNQGYKPARFGKRHGFVLTDEGKAFKDRLLMAARQAWTAAGRPAPLEQAAVAARIVYPTRGSDIDGAYKFVQDCLAPAGLIVNDNRVRRVVLEKPAPDDSPRVEIAVGPLGERCPTCGCCCGSVRP